MELEDLYLRTVESLAVAVEVKDQTTYGHIRRVKAYAAELARLCGIRDPKELKAIRTGSLLHDIGKLVIDDYILNKPGPLSGQEFEKIKMHVRAGDEILQQVHFPFPVADYVRCHHERWDGLGYPNGLKGEQIPLGGRILAIADAFDAIRYSRPYKLPVDIGEALEILRSQSGTAYDPNLVQIFIDNIDELERSAARESRDIPELSFRKSMETADHAILNSDVSAEVHKTQNYPVEIVRLAEFCDTSAGYLELADFLPILSRRIKYLVPFSTCAFYLDDGNGHVKAECVTGCFSGDLEGRRFTMGKGIGGWVTAYGRPMVNAKPALDFQYTACNCSQLKKALAVPILTEDSSFGAVCLYGEEHDAYSQADLEILQTIAGLAAPVISKIRARNAAESDDSVDPATQIHRVSYLAAVGPQLLSSARTNKVPVSLIYLEIRHLYRILRTYGTEAGDSILRGAADSIKSELRETDILVRFGKGAFLAFLPGVHADQAIRCAQRLKQQMKNRPVNLGDRNFSVEYRVGLASYPKDGSTLFTLLQSARRNIGLRTSQTGTAGRKIISFFPRF